MAADSLLVEHAPNEVRGELHHALPPRSARGILIAATAAWVLVLALFLLVRAAAADDGVTISQKGRVYAPGHVEIERGQSIRIVNDDAQLLHHSYIMSAKLNYDSGGQEPGSAVEIEFPSSGDYHVLCAIHPKMRLAVKVQ